MVGAEHLVSLFIHPQDAGHMFIRQQGHAARVVRTVDDNFLKTETINASPQVLQTARRLHIARQRGELVGDDPLPPRARRSHCPDKTDSFPQMPVSPAPAAA